MFQGTDSATNNFVSYTKYLKDKKQNELKLIRKIKSKDQCSSQFPLNENKNQISEPSEKEKGPQLDKCRREQGEKRDKWMRIDDKASIVKGKLVYLQQQKPSLEKTEELIWLLRKNQVNLKSYLFGEKRQILKDIEQRQEKKRSQEIERYINKNMKQESIVKVNCSKWYNEAKNSLFENK